MADYEAVSPTTGNLIALCSVCGTVMYRRARFADLERICRNLELAFTEGSPRVGDGA